jgi:hypothetical protein
MCELHEIMRQKGDAASAVPLYHMANGTMTLDDVSLIQSRCTYNDITIPKEAICLFATEKLMPIMNRSYQQCKESQA